MSIFVGLSIGISSAVTISGLVRFSLVIGRRVIKNIKRKKEKKKLKTKLRDSIEQVNYHNFINTIYEIKTYDDKYNKNFYIKSKLRYSFREIHFESLRNFNRRFSDDYDEKELMVRDIVQNEIEKSLSLILGKSRLDL